MVIFPELVTLAQLIVTYVQEKRTTKRVRQEVNYENFLEWLIKNNHEKVLQFLKKTGKKGKKTFPNIAELPNFLCGKISVMPRSLYATSLTLSEEGEGRIK